MVRKMRTWLLGNLGPIILFGTMLLMAYKEFVVDVTT